MHIKNFINVIKTFDNWYSYLIDFWLKKKGLLKYNLRDGNIIFIRSGSDDRFIINEIYVHEVYNPPLFKIKPTDTVVDIGGHIGIFSLFASKRAKMGKIFCFEPNPNNFSLLQKHIEINNIKNILCYNLAVSNNVKVKEFYIAKNRYFTGRHSLLPYNGPSDKILVKSTSLENIIKMNNIDRINFLKLDCEGAEFEILFNLKNDILNRIDRISMEFHNIDEKNNAINLKSFLQNNGFNVFISKKGQLLFAYKNFLN